MTAAAIFGEAMAQENKLFYTQQANGIMGLAPVMPAAWAPMEAGSFGRLFEQLVRKLVEQLF